MAMPEVDKLLIDKFSFLKEYGFQGPFINRYGSNISAEHLYEYDGNFGITISYEFDPRFGLDISINKLIDRKVVYKDEYEKDLYFYAKMKGKLPKDMNKQIDLYEKVLKDNIQKILNEKDTLFTVSEQENH